MDVSHFIKGDSPLLLSVPHDGTFVPEEIANRFTEDSARLPDTDWHIERLYDFVNDLNANIITALHSRYVVDLNRSSDDIELYPGEINSCVVPIDRFDGEHIYEGDHPDDSEIEDRVKRYWKPYHDRIESELDTIKEQFGYAILIDVHSVPSEIPRLFEGVLPDINIGTNRGKSASSELVDKVFEICQRQARYSTALDGRFTGGYITRKYGNPDNNIHSLQLEISQKNYMDEKSFKYNTQDADQLKRTLSSIFQTILEWKP